MVKHGSHAAHQPFFEGHTVLSPKQQATTPDFYIFQPPELPFWDAYESRPLSAPAGSLFLWDSRTAHQNVLPQTAEQWRHVCYCCYQPRWVG